MVTPMSRHTTFMRLRAASLGLLCLSFTAPAFADVTKGPDKGGYSGTDVAVFSFIDVAALGGAGVLSGIDDGTAALTLPFNFKFYGQSYSIVCVSANGALYFVPTPAACNGINDFANADPTNAAPPPGQDFASVFPFWSDLKFEGAGGGVFYQALGSAGSRQFVL